MSYDHTGLNNAYGHPYYAAEYTPFGPRLNAVPAMIHPMAAAAAAAAAAASSMPLAAMPAAPLMTVPGMSVPGNSGSSSSSSAGPRAAAGMGAGSHLGHGASAGSVLGHPIAVNPSAPLYLPMGSTAPPPLAAMPSSALDTRGLFRSGPRSPVHAAAVPASAAAALPTSHAHMHSGPPHHAGSSHPHPYTHPHAASAPAPAPAAVGDPNSSQSSSSSSSRSSASNHPPPSGEPTTLTPFLPLRPGHGMAGRPVSVRANFFPILTLPRKPIHQYTVAIEPKVPTAVARQVWQMWEAKCHGLRQVPDAAQLRIVYDARGAAYASRPLTLPLAYDGETATSATATRTGAGEGAGEASAAAADAADAAADTTAAAGGSPTNAVTAPLRSQTFTVYLPNGWIIEEVPPGASGSSSSAAAAAHDDHHARQLSSSSSLHHPHQKGPRDQEASSKPSAAAAAAAAQGTRPKWMTAYQLTITYSHPIDPTRLKAYLNGVDTAVPSPILVALDTILRHRPSQLYTTMGRCYYTPDAAASIASGVQLWQGFHQGLKATQQRLLINLDVSATAFYQAAPILTTIAKILGRSSPMDLHYPLTDRDRLKIERSLKGVRIVVRHQGTIRRKYRITRLTTTSAERTLFPLDPPSAATTAAATSGEGASDAAASAPDRPAPTQISVKQYFWQRYKMRLHFAHLPCIVAGDPARHIYLPLEACDIIEGQRHLRKLNERQTAEMIKFTCQPPHIRSNKISAGVTLLQPPAAAAHGGGSSHDLVAAAAASGGGGSGSAVARLPAPSHWPGSHSTPMPGVTASSTASSAASSAATPSQDAARSADQDVLTAFNLSIGCEMTTVPGRVLRPPTVQYHPASREPQITPVGGAWNLRDKMVVQGTTLRSWSVVAFGAEQDYPLAAVQKFVTLLVHTCDECGLFVENRQPPISYADPQPGTIERTLIDAYMLAGNSFQERPQLLVCILPNTGVPLYAEIKRVTDTVIGVASQCVQAKHMFAGKRQYCANVCLKLNVKLGGMNSFLPLDQLPFIGERPTIVFGADVTHPAPQSPSQQSIAALVGSVDAQCALYVASVRVQRHRQEVIQDLTEMAIELLKTFYQTCGAKPERLLYYRDGLSEPNAEAVCRQEVALLMAACAALDPDYRPTLTYVAVQKRHHARFFPIRREDADKSGNIVPGTCIEQGVTHPTQYDFYLCSHPGLQGTSKPTHYHVLLDENRLGADVLQQLTYRLCFLYGRATRSVSVVPPTYYAHLVAARARFHVSGEGMAPPISASGSLGPPLTHAALAAAAAAGTHAAAAAAQAQAQAQAQTLQRYKAEPAAAASASAMSAMTAALRGLSLSTIPGAAMAAELTSVDQAGASSSHGHGHSHSHGASAPPLPPQRVVTYGVVKPELARVMYFM